MERIARPHTIFLALKVNDLLLRISKWWTRNIVYRPHFTI